MEFGHHVDAVRLLFIKQTGIPYIIPDAWKISCTSLLKNIIVNYPYGKYLGHEDKVVSVKVKLFSRFALKKNFHDCDLKILKKWNIHSLTNILPRTET